MTDFLSSASHRTAGSWGHGLTALLGARSRAYDVLPKLLFWIKTSLDQRCFGSKGFPGLFYNNFYSWQQRQALRVFYSAVHNLQTNFSSRHVILLCYILNIQNSMLLVPQTGIICTMYSRLTSSLNYVRFALCRGFNSCWPRGPRTSVLTVGLVNLNKSSAGQPSLGNFHVIMH